MSAVLSYLLSLSFQQAMLRLSFVPILVDTAIGLVRFRRLPLNLRWLVGLLVFVALMNLVGLVFMLLRRNNLFLMPPYTVGELAGLALVYRYTLRSATFAKYLPWLVGGFAAYVLASWLLAPHLLRFRPDQQVVQSLLVLAMVGLHARQLLREPLPHPLLREPMFWVSAGLFLYFMGYVQIALFSNYLLRYSSQLNMNVWAIHSALSMGCYGCYARALWIARAK